MNRAFTAIIAGISCLLIVFLLVLVGELTMELWRQSFVSSPDFEEIFFAVRLSLITATISSLLALLVSIPVSYLFTRYSFPGKNFFDTVLDIPIVLSPIALGAMLLIFFKSPMGSRLGQWLGPFVFSVKGIVIAQFLVVVGLSIRLLRATFEGMDEEYENLARTLGYNRFQVFLRVVLPQAWKGLVAAFLLTWGRAVGEFGATITLAGAMTMKTETIPVAIYLNFESADISNALVFIAILITMSVAILFFMRTVHARVRV